MRLFAIADLHLSFARPKPMDVFGDHWRDHPARVAQAWRAAVEPADVVLVAGDVSWAMKPAEAAADLAWLRELPGHKVLVKGNHDYWYPESRPKRSALLGPGLTGLYRSAAVVGGVGFVGGKGAPLDPAEVEDPERHELDLLRQAKSLEASVADLDAQGFDGPRVALLHYPPTGPREDRSLFTDLLERAGVSLCVYGHLHTAEDFACALQGTRRAVTYRLTSADYLGFRLLEVTADVPSACYGDPVR